ncbi:hypothetical protein [Hymenobacter jejuensis]|uniref:Uncharacterized protein n=1 Tax=Hymenobacter jejuensis TaxID=2502781 RepID=A0A5B7ZW12_9BACT|nr:hypothetical protein [Hymenobacter jejuensis]QDA58683.1 hypothetical protein FHG12_00560 [Hymenobacter jejuensis]
MRTLIITRQRTAVGLFGGLMLLAAACFGSVHSDLFIEPSHQFVLGGGQRGAFMVVARNVGPTAVEALERPATGKLMSKAILKLGQQVTLRFASGSAAVLANPAATTAHLDLQITGDTDLSMSTEAKRP